MGGSLPEACAGRLRCGRDLSGGLVPSPNCPWLSGSSLCFAGDSSCFSGTRSCLSPVRCLGFSPVRRLGFPRSVAGALTVWGSVGAVVILVRAGGVSAAPDRATGPPRGWKRPPAATGLPSPSLSGPSNRRAVHGSALAPVRAPCPARCQSARAPPGPDAGQPPGQNRPPGRAARHPPKGRTAGPPSPDGAPDRRARTGRRTIEPGRGTGPGHQTIGPDPRAVAPDPRHRPARPATNPRTNPRTSPEPAAIPAANPARTPPPTPRPPPPVPGRSPPGGW